MTIADVAKAFIYENDASCHNATTTEGVYKLHGHVIAEHPAIMNNGIRLDWCGYYTKTTADHMNRILDAFRERYGNALVYKDGVYVPIGKVSYASARDANVGLFYVYC